MTAPEGPSEGAGVPARVFGIGSAVVVMVGAVLLLGRALADRDTIPAHPAPTIATAPTQPIAAEADVFRRAADPLDSTSRTRRREAHPRTLALTRTLRAYPGAPPRIPHGLTAGEFRDVTCNSCHESGGYVARFAAYAPVTPHPEYGACLQCHAVDDAVVGVVVRDHAADAVCIQCHVPGRTFRPFVALDWRPAAWPPTGQRAMEGSPLLLPHDFQLRSNCIACHSGPGSVHEIRTTHPERANCRQCHLPAATEEVEFSRPDAAHHDASGGGS